jgi:SOS-response transcriptional repressor LexA
MPVQTGELAVVVIGDETTLKRVYDLGDSFNLIPENSKYPPIIKKKSKLSGDFVAFYKVLGVFTSIK